MELREPQPHHYFGGTEMEYPIIVEETDGSGERDLQADEIDQILDVHAPQELTDPARPNNFYGLWRREQPGASNGFATNGGRLYLDIGGKLEYATPECTSYADTTLASIAGEHIVVGALHRLIANNPDQLRSFTALGRVHGIDIQGNMLTWGRHENYLLPRHVFNQLSFTSTGYLPHLGALHLATRSLFSGGGALWRKPDGTLRFELSQKIPSLSTAIGLGTTGPVKPLLSVRDEPHSPEDAYGRWHVTPGDYLLSPWAQWLTLGSTALVGYLAGLAIWKPYDKIQHLMLPDDLAVYTAKSVSRNPNHSFFLANGTRVTAINVQEMLLDAVELYHNEAPELFTDEDRLVMQQWRWAIDQHRQGGERLRNIVDWRARKHIIESYVGPKNPTALQLEQAWDNLASGAGVRLRDKTPMPGYDPALIAQYKHTPPSNSARATTRSNLIRMQGVNGYQVQSADWGKVILQSTEIHKSLLDTALTLHIRHDHYSLHDPFKSLTAQQRSYPSANS